MEQLVVLASRIVRGVYIFSWWYSNICFHSCSGLRIVSGPQCWCQCSSDVGNGTGEKYLQLKWVTPF